MTYTVPRSVTILSIIFLINVPPTNVIITLRSFLFELPRKFSRTATSRRDISIYLLRVLCTLQSSNEKQ